MNFNRIINYFIASDYNQESWEYRRHKLFVSVCFISALYAALYMPAAFIEEYYGAIIVQLIFIFLNVSYPFLLKKKVSFAVLSTVWILTLGTALLSIMLISGGIYHTSTDPQLLVLMPVMALLFLNFRWALFYLVLATAIVVTIGVLQLYGVEFPHRMNPEYIQIQNLMAVAGHAILVFMVITIFENQKNKALKKALEKSNLLLIEKERSDELLHNILPLSIIKELKDTGKTTARSYDAASVMITNFTNFETVNEVLNPQEIVKEIDTCYLAFDKIIEHNGLEIIKTVGHAYIAVCGLPIKDEEHADKITTAALEIKRFMQKRYLAYGLFEVRIGIHSGPMIAGIVGIRKFTYDIWGHTINTACQIEALGETGKINISNATYKLIENKFEVMPRGLQEIPGEGSIEMFFVEEI